MYIIYMSKTIKKYQRRKHSEIRNNVIAVIQRRHFSLLACTENIEN